MLHFSAKGEYAALAILSLSLHGDQRPLQVKVIAKAEQIPLRFLEQVMSQLKKKGLVDSVRGPHGGYRLTRSPDQITLGEVLQAIEGPPSSDVPLDQNGRQAFGRLVLREVWAEANEALSDQLNSIHFDALCEKRREKEGTAVLMFHI